MRRVSFLVSLATVLCAIPARGDELSLLGFNPESIALGGAITAGPSGAAGAFYNPAALNKNHKQESEVSYVWFKPVLHIDRKADTDMDAYLKTRPQSTDTKNYNVIQFKRDLNDYQENRAERVPLVRGYNIGLVIPLAENRKESRASLGAAIHMPQGPILRQRVNAPDTPYFLEFDDRSQRIVVNGAVGVDINDDLHVGAGASFLLNIPVNVDAFVPINFNVADILKPDNAGLNVSVTPLAEVSLTPVIAPVGGVLWDATNWFSIGATFRDQIKATVDANARILAETGTGNQTALPIKLSSSTAFTPRQLALGVKVKPVEKLTIYADATWSQWSEYRPPLANFEVSHIRQLIREVIEGSGIEDLGILGGKIKFGDQTFDVPTTDAIVNAVPDFVKVDYQFKGFRDTWTPRVGVAYQVVDDVSVMGGYFFRPSIEDKGGVEVIRITNLGGKVTRTHLNQNTLDNDQHGFSAGAIYKHGIYQLGLAAMYIQLVEKTVDKTSSLDITYPDESDKLGLQTTAYGYPGFSYGGHVAGGMLQGSVAF